MPIVRFSDFKYEIEIIGGEASLYQRIVCM